MRTRKTAKKPPELKVVFDTNALFNGSASDLLSHAVSQLIKSNSHYHDLTISWHLPEIVMLERQYQMRKRGLELLPTLQKMERLLGHNLNITEKIIEERIEDAIEKQSRDHKISIVTFNPSQVDWTRMMMDAVYRKPPFEPGEKEKGFRDSLVAETFIQLVENSPTTPRVCRVAMVTNDTLLAQCVKARTDGRTNVRVLSSLEDLKSLINTLAEEIDEEFVNKIKEQATDYFFSHEERDGLYYSEGIQASISERFESELNQPVEGSNKREIDNWYIYPPRFLKKERQRVYWVSRIEVNSRSVNIVREGNYIYISSSKGTYIPFAGTHTGINTDNLAQKSPYLQNTSGVLQPMPDIWAEMVKRLAAPQKPDTLPTPIDTNPVFTTNVIANGVSVFEITWSVTVSTTYKLSAPKIEDISFVETTWTQP